ncbi:MULTISPECIES: trypsin-like peptidase domain-containing protein [Myxococcus]|uniref:MXAN_2756 family trypsin-like serine endoprotease n=1 Tax=Myxococcus TaxID=32 RepID=UPI0013D88992|nr:MULTISPECIES: trypsin-like peptidase domain-containing protein [Myxococcus]NVJ23136.1 serine protease [Myxococcus sp. AM011]
MSRLSPLALALCLVTLPASSADPGKPSRADLQRVMEQHSRSVVTVNGPRSAGPGVFVGSAGQVLTSMESVGQEYVGLNVATVEHEGQALPARVLVANVALKVAVVAAPDGTYPAVPVRLLKEGDSLEGRWVVGVVPGARNRPAKPEAAQATRAPAPFYDVPLALPPGSPLFDSDGRVVAVVVQRTRRGCRVLPLGEVKLTLASANEP